MDEPRIETRPALRLAGVRARFVSALAADSDAPDVIGPLWGRLHEQLEGVTPVEPGVFYGWTTLAPEASRSRPDELEYVAGVEVAPDAQAPEGMVAVETAAGLYAVFEHRGPIWTFHDAVRWIYEEWLPASPYEGNGIGDLERYDARWAPDREDSVFEFLVGIRPRAAG